MTGTIQQKLDIAYREFNNKVNQIVNSEISKCNNNLSTLNNQERIENLKARASNLQLEALHKEVVQSYSPHLNISTNLFTDDDLSVKNIPTPKQVPSQWKKDQSRLEKLEKQQKLKNGTNANIHYNPQIYQTNNKKTCQDLCNMLHPNENGLVKAEKICNADDKDCKIKCFVGGNQKSELRKDSCTM